MEWFWVAFILSSVGLLLGWLFCELVEMIIEADGQDPEDTKEDNP